MREVAVTNYVIALILTTKLVALAVGLAILDKYFFGRMPRRRYRAQEISNGPAPGVIWRNVEKSIGPVGVI